MMKCHENQDQFTETKRKAPVKKVKEYKKTTIQQPEETFETKQTPEKFEDAEGLFECDICGLCYDRKLNILLHMKMYHITNLVEKDPENGRKHKCDQCDTSLSCASNLIRHKKRFHSGDNPYPCNICPHRFRYHRLLKLHHQKFHNGEIFPEDQVFDPRKKSASCQYCDKDFRGNRRHLEAHMLRYHLDEFEPLECHMCWKKVVFPETLKNHIETHKRNIKRQSFTHECPICLKRFLKSESLDKHIKSH